MKPRDARTTPPRNDASVVPAGPAMAAAKPSRLWLWVVAAFVLQIAVWTAWIVLASKNKVQEVPLVHAVQP